MTRTFIICIIFLVLLVSPSFAWEGRVVHVSDGDTVQVEPIEGGQRVKVRLYGIDCPESKQPHGSIAKGFVSDFALFKTVDVQEYDVDRYGRSVSVVKLTNELNVNEELIRRGHAWVYDKYCKRDFCPDWKGLELQAQEAGRGLWRDKDAIPPWDWRKRH